MVLKNEKLELITRRSPAWFILSGVEGIPVPTTKKTDYESSRFFCDRRCGDCSKVIDYINL